MPQPASVFQPVSDSHRSAAVEIVTAARCSLSLEETYEALRIFGVLGIDKKVRQYLRLLVSLWCWTWPPGLRDASSLFDFHFSVGGLVLVKEQRPEVDVILHNAQGTFQSIKALTQSDGRWRYGPNNPESSSYAAGVALETLAGVIKLADPEVNSPMISTVKNDLNKLFDSIKKYDDGTFYFNEKVIDSLEYRGPLATSSAVVLGLTAFASVTSENVDIPGEKLLGLAKFFLAIGVPGFRCL